MTTDALAEPLPSAAKGAPNAAALDLATVAVLWKRDMIRLFRAKARLAGAVGQPLLFWLVIGSGMATTFQVPGSDVGYMQFFFPGIVAMVVLFTSIFSTMSVIEDRNEGFLQSVLTAPGSRGAVALGKILGGTTVAVLQAALFLVMCPFAGFPLLQVSWAFVFAVLFFVSVGLTALGFALAWYTDSTSGYHAIMGVLLMPMWVLSGAMFPTQSKSVWLTWIMRMNPVTYAVEALRRGLYGGHVPPSVGLGFGSGALELSVVAAFALVATAGAVALCRRRS